MVNETIADPTVMGGLLSSGTASGLLNGVVMMISLVVIIGTIAIGLWLYFEKIHKYRHFKCIIFQRNGFGQLEQKQDKAGIFVDRKTKNKRFFLKRAMVGLDPDNVPYMSGGKKKTVYLLQTGLKNFRFINVNINEPAIKLTVGEEDVNWAINAYERQKKLFQDSIWLQILPFITIAFVTIIILVIFIYFFKNFDVLKDVAIALRETASELAKANADTVIINGEIV